MTKGAGIMKSTGITRPVDALGRVVIPMEIREHFGIKTKDLLEIYINEDQIILTKYGNSCIICGSKEGELKELNGKHVCAHCLNELNKG